MVVMILIQILGVLQCQIDETIFQLWSRAMILR